MDTSNRKGRLELWLGLGCVLLVGCLAFGAAYRHRIQAGWHRRGFESGPRASCWDRLRSLHSLGPEGRRHLRAIFAEKPEELEILKRRDRTILLRNNRDRRVCFRGVARAELEIVEIDDLPPSLEYVGEAILPIPQTDWLPSDRDKAIRETLCFLLDGKFVGRVLEPGEEAEFWLHPDQWREAVMGLGGGAQGPSRSRSQRGPGSEAPNGARAR